MCMSHNNLILLPFIIYTRCTSCTGIPLTVTIGGIATPLENLGCWKDTSRSRAIPTLENQSNALLDGEYRRRDDAIRKCAQAASDLGYTTFALQNGGGCASSSVAGNTYKKHCAATNCNPVGTGGGDANQVYEISGKYSCTAVFM